MGSKPTSSVYRAFLKLDVPSTARPLLLTSAAGRAFRRQQRRMGREYIATMVVWGSLIVLTNGICLSSERFSTTPTKAPSGQKWRIGYYEGGDYTDYRATLLATVSALMDLGWLEKADTGSLRQTKTSDIWRWLATDAKSDYINFVQDAFYSSGWQDTLRKKTQKNVINRLNHRNDIDVMIAMGTWAGQDLANNLHRTNTLVMTASDALASGIIKDIEDSGFDHIHAHVDPTMYERQVAIFHDIIQFSRLGIIYEDSVAGRSYAAVDKLERLSQARGFELIKCFAVSDIPDSEQREQEYIACFEKIAPKIDALYVTVHGGVSDRSINKIIAIANRHRIPTLSQAGAHEVQEGILLSVSRKDFKKTGLFQAATMANVLNGAKPRDLVQVFEDSPHISLNLRTAEKVGILLPADALAAADVIYR